MFTAPYQSAPPRLALALMQMVRGKTEIGILKLSWRKENAPDVTKSDERTSGIMVLLALQVHEDTSGRVNFQLEMC
jgi:hypothetical protein